MKQVRDIVHVNHLTPFCRSLDRGSNTLKYHSTGVRPMVKDDLNRDSDRTPSLSEAVSPPI